MKILKIDCCKKCHHLNVNMYGERCFHPKVVKPHPEGVVPKDVGMSYLTEIPEWCPLENDK